MRKYLLFAASVLTGCASLAPSVSKGTAAPITVVVIAQSPLRQGDADLYRRVIEDYLHRYVRDGKPLTLTLSLDRDVPGFWSRDASENGYAAVNYGFGSSNGGGHTVPLVGGMSVAETGFQPRVGGSGGGFGSSPFVSGFLYASYQIKDASGRVIESRGFPVMPLAYFYGPGPTPGQTLQRMHDTASFLAQRVAAVH